MTCLLAAPWCSPLKILMAEGSVPRENVVTRPRRAECRSFRGGSAVHALTIYLFHPRMRIPEITVDCMMTRNRSISVIDRTLVVDSSDDGGTFLVENLFLA